MPQRNKNSKLFSENWDRMDIQANVSWLFQASPPSACMSVLCHIVRDESPYVTQPWTDLPGGGFDSLNPFQPSRHIFKHKDEVAEASGHDEEVEYFVRTEIFVPRVKERELQGVNDATRRVEDAACQQPQKRGAGQKYPKLSDDGQACPAHSDIEDGGKPFRAGDPERLDQDARQRDAPHDSEQGIALSAL